MKFLFLLCCLAANAHSQPQYNYNQKPIPFELECSKNGNKTELPTLTWFARYHFKIKNADMAHLNIVVTAPFEIVNFRKDTFELVFNLPSDSLLKQYLEDTIAVVCVKNGKETAEFRLKMQPVPYIVFLLSAKKFQPEPIDTCDALVVQGVWERPPCATYYNSRFYGCFSTALYDVKGNKLQQYEGWYDSGDRTREYDLSAKKYGLQKGDIVELRIAQSLQSWFRGFPEWARKIMIKKLKISPMQPLTQRFRLQ
jgi:hypothetical protein